MRTPELLSDPVYHDEEAARLYLQEIRWPDGVFCPFCGTLDDIKPLGGKSMGPGWFYCPACQDKFTVRVGSTFERSHIPLSKWLLAFRLMASSKKGISAHRLHRTLAITYKSAWFLAHRIRECMADTDPTPLGGKDKLVEADETEIGRAGDPEDSVFVNGRGWVRKGGEKKITVATPVERGGKARSV
jgi:transposase-like protein